MTIHPRAGKSPATLINISTLVNAYYSGIPNPSNPAQQVIFGTSGHRGTSIEKSFNEHHILAITQAVCLYRASQNITGPLFMGIDTHALSRPALQSALEVLAANGVEVMLAENDEYTPTPVISHAILTHNQGRSANFADGIVITPSHNPPQDGGFKYNPPNGGPADTTVTNWIQSKANEFLTNNLIGVKRIPYEKAIKAASTHHHNFLDSYIADLSHVIDMDLIRDSKISIGADPLGGAGVHYWTRIASHYHLNLTVVSDVIDPTFGFMTLDWDGQIRMDPSSPYAMQRLIEMKDRFDVSFGCDTDHDRHGIVTKSAGLMPSNHFLSAASYYLFQHRPDWSGATGIGKTVVSTMMLDRIATHLKRPLYEVPVGFKWFVDGLINKNLAFVCEESAGATFVRRNGAVWTTDKDAITASLLAAEMTARLGKDPGVQYQELSKKFGALYSNRVEAKASFEQRERLKKLQPEQLRIKDLAGDAITAITSHAPGNGAAIGGIKVATANGWFAARPSGTENIYKIYGESAVSKEHLAKIIDQAQGVVNAAILA